MGQAYSYKDTPTPEPSEILGDPQCAAHFVCRRNAPSSKNYNVYKDSVDGPLWLFVRKTGHTLQKKQPTTMVLENFKKEVLCFTRLEPMTDDQLNPTYSFKNLVKRKLEGSSQIGETKHETINTIAHDKLEWKCQTKADFYCSHAMTESVAEVFVKAAGSVMRETQKIKGRDSENFPSNCTVCKETKQVDRLQYVIRINGVQDLFFSLEEPNSLTPVWNCPLFCASVIPSDDWRWRWDIKVKDGYDPSLSLLIGLVCSCVLSPEKIMGHLAVHWS